GRTLSSQPTAPSAERSRPRRLLSGFHGTRTTCELPRSLTVRTGSSGPTAPQETHPRHDIVLTPLSTKTDIARRHIRCHDDIMDLTPYVTAIRDDLNTAAAAGDETTQRAAATLSAALEPAVRLAVMNAMSDLAAEVTAALPEHVVDVR